MSVSGKCLCLDFSGHWVVYMSSLRESEMSFRKLFEELWHHQAGIVDNCLLS